MQINFFLCVILVVKLGFWAVLQKSLWDQQILPKIQFFGVYDNSQNLSFLKMPDFLILGLNIMKFEIIQNMSAIFYAPVSSTVF